MKTRINGYELEGTVSEIREILQIHTETKKNVMRKQLNEKRNNKFSSWTKEDDALLCAAYAKRKRGFIKKLSRELKRTAGAINTRAYTLQITKKR